MTETIKLSGEVYEKLAQGAAERGMTIESLLAVFSDLVTISAEATQADRRRNRSILRLLDRLRTEKLNSNDRKELDALIDEDYQAANRRADALIREREGRIGNGRPTRRKAQTD